METNIGFSPWISWANRNSLPGKDKPGVYLIGTFAQPPPSGPADPFDKHVVYIGESARGTFQSRWRSFKRSAFQGKGKHRGGEKCKDKLGGDSSQLYVSILPDKEIVKAFLEPGKCLFIDDITGVVKETDAVGSDGLLELDKFDDLLIKYVERRLILLYSVRHGKRPPCNTD